jgi:hypothetical protein
MNGLSNALMAIIALWSLPNFFSPPTHSYSWQIDLQQNIHSVVTDLNGSTTIQEWDQPFIKVETMVRENTGSEYSLSYSEKLGHFRLETRFEKAGTQLVIASRRINTVVYVDGKEAKTSKHFNVYLPRHLRYEAAISK